MLDWSLALVPEKALVALEKSKTGVPNLYMAPLFVLLIFGR